MHLRKLSLLICEMFKLLKPAVLIPLEIHYLQKISDLKNSDVLFLTFKLWTLFLSFRTNFRHFSKTCLK